MVINIKLDEGAIMPTRAHIWDAGMDLYSMEDGDVKDVASFDTGVHLQIPAGFVGLVRSRSGMMMKQKITTDGTVDSGYTGSIRICLMNHGDKPYHVNKGDKIAQLVITPCALPELIKVDELANTTRGDDGFGSTGR